MRSEIENIIDLAKAVRQSSIKRLVLTPQGYENWSISPNALSIAEIVHHLIEADNWLLEKLINPNTQSFKASKGHVQIDTRDSYRLLIAKLEQCLVNKISFLETITPIQLEEKIPDDRFGGNASRWWVIVRGNIDHEIHHRGQLAAYLRVLQDTGLGLSEA
jgi:uncharacterized damage-inducible protein DinB